jgi:hypothetical protein
MSWIGWTLLVLFVLGLIGNLSSKKSRGAIKGRRPRSGPRRDVESEAQEMAAKIKTIKQFQALRERQERTDAQQFQAKTDRGMESAAYKADVLRAAMDIAEKNVHEWQLLPTMDLETPKSILNLAYKVFSEEEYQKIETTLPESEGYFYWSRLDVWNEPEAPEESLETLKKFRTVVESNLTQATKIKKINKLVEDEYEFLGDFLDQTDEMSPGDDWFASQLQKEGLPMAYQLYSKGFTTPEKCLLIDPPDFAKMPGADHQHVEQLIKYQEKVKQTLSIQPEQAKSDDAEPTQ